MRNIVVLRALRAIAACAVGVLMAAAPSTQPSGDTGATVTRKHDISAILKKVVLPANAPVDDKRDERFPDQPIGVAMHEVSDEAAVQLCRTVMHMIAPESWRDMGGTVGSLKVEKNTLVIIQTEAAHKQIADLLAALSQGKAPRLVTGSKVEDKDVLVNAYAIATFPSRTSGAKWKGREPLHRLEVIDQLRERIYGSVNSDSWADKGGTTGFIDEFGGLLFVRHTDAVQKDVAAALTKWSGKPVKSGPGGR